MKHADKALEALDRFIERMSNNRPVAENGYEWDFGHDDAKALREAAFRIPNSAVRDSVENALNLLGGWQTLASHGSPEDSWPYEQQRRALRELQMVLGACVRGEPIPADVVADLKHRSNALDDAYAARNEDDEALRRTE